MTSLANNVSRNTVHACLLSWFSHVRLFETLWTVAPLSMGFSRQECCSGLPCPPPSDLPSSGVKSASLVSLPWEAHSCVRCLRNVLKVWNTCFFIFFLLPLEKEMATHSNVLVWRIQGTEKPARAVHGIARVGRDLARSFFLWGTKESFHSRSHCSRTLQIPLQPYRTLPTLLPLYCFVPNMNTNPWPHLLFQSRNVFRPNKFFNHINK